MVQLPSAARLSGNSRPCVGGGLLHGLQHAAGLDRHRQVGAVDRADAVQPRQAQQHLRAAGVGHAAADQAGVAALRHHARAVRGAGAHHRGHLGGVCRAARRPARGRASACASRAPRPTGRPRSARGAAPTAAAQRRAAARSSRGSGSRPRRRAAQPPAHVQRAGHEQQQAQQHLDAGQHAPRPAVAGGAHHAFGEVQPHQQAAPSGRCTCGRVSSPASGISSGSTFSASVPLPVGASHSSQARPSTISPSRLPTASRATSDDGVGHARAAEALCGVGSWLA